MYEQELLQLMKQAATEAVQAERPADWVLGTVTSEKPLRIKLETGIECDEDFLLLSRSVTDYETEVTVRKEDAWHTQEASLHTHALVLSRKTIRVHNALKQGESVLLLRKAGGQEYVVLDRVVKA